MSELDQMNPDELNKALFSHLTMSLASSAMQHLGKLVNPSTGKTAVNLEAAQSTIDIIEMIRVKTKGNLDHEEARFLDQTLTALRLNYVESKSAAPAAKPAEGAGEKPADAAS